MDKRLQQASDWLKKEMERDLKEVEVHKNQLIDEIKSIDKKNLFVEKPKPKTTVFKKILKIFGYDKKR